MCVNVSVCRVITWNVAGLPCSHLTTRILSHWQPPIPARRLHTGVNWYPNDTVAIGEIRSPNLVSPTVAPMPPCAWMNQWPWKSSLLPALLSCAMAVYGINASSDAAIVMIVLFMAFPFYLFFIQREGDRFRPPSPQYAINSFRCRSVPCRSLSMRIYRNMYPDRLSTPLVFYGNFHINVNHFFKVPSTL